MTTETRVRVAWRMPPGPLVALALVCTGCQAGPRFEAGSGLGDTQVVTPASSSPSLEAPHGSSAYPDPAAALTGRVPDPELRPTREAPPQLDRFEAVLRAALPAGVKVEIGQRTSWYGDAPETGEFHAIAYRHDDEAGVAVVAGQPPRMLWDLGRDAGLDGRPIEAWPIEAYYGAGPGVIVMTDARAELLRFALGETPQVIERYALPSLPATVAETRPTSGHRIAYDLNADGLADPILMFPEWNLVALYERAGDGTLRLAGSVAPGALLIDTDRDGQPELIEPKSEGAWSRKVWQAGGYVTHDTLSAPNPPRALPVVAEDLPALPGQLSFVVHGDRRLRRWPREGGTLRTLWSAESRDRLLRGLQVSQDGSALLLATAGSEKGSPEDARLTLVNVDGPATDLPTLGSLRGFTLSADGRRAAYVGLGVGADGGPLPEDDSRIPSLERGTIFGIDTSAPDTAIPLAACEAQAVHEWWTVGCMGDVSIRDDGRQVAFADVRGLWQVGFDGAEPTKLIEQFYVEDDGPGSRIYYPDRWSPDGRWFLVRVGGYEGSDPAILDLDTGDARTIPDAWNYGRSSQQAWLPDSSGLLVTRWGAGADEASPELRVVDALDPDASQAVLDLVPLSADHRYLAYGPATAPDGSLRFGLRHPDARLWLANGVYRASRDGSALKRLASLPALVEDASGANADLLTWAPDGAAFVAQFQDGRSRRTLVGLADGSAVWDASAVLNQADWITWSR